MRGVDCQGARQIALRMCKSRIFREGIDVVRRDIENLIKFPQSVGETTKELIGKHMLTEYVNVARIEPLGFVKVRLAAVPLALSSCNICDGFRNPAVIGQKRTRLLKVTQRGVVILQARVVVITLGQYRLAKIGLKSESSFGCLPCLFTQADRGLKSRCDVAARINV